MEDGALYDPILGGRIFCLSARTFIEMYSFLANSCSKDAANALLYNLGLRYGLSLGKKVMLITGDNPDEGMKTLSDAALKSGWGRSEISNKLGQDNMIEVSMVNCVFCEEADDGRSGCYFLAGILNGIAESLFSQTFKTVETECKASGGPVCRFIIKPL